MQHEAALGLHRAAEIHRLVGKVFAVERELDLLEKVLQLDVDRLVDHQSERALVGVLAQVDHRARERIVRHAGHGDQELVRQVDLQSALDMRGSIRIADTGGAWTNPSIERSVWFRRDLRADDHAALYHALRAAHHVWCAFVFDTAILDRCSRARRPPRRVHPCQPRSTSTRSCVALGRSHGVEDAGLIVRHGAAATRCRGSHSRLGVQAVFANHDDDPDALARDAKVRGALADAGVVLHTSKDHVIFERAEVMTGAGSPYSVFTPYKNAWLAKLDPFFVRAYGVDRYAAALAPRPAGDGLNGVPALASSASNPPTCAS